MTLARRDLLIGAAGSMIAASHGQAHAQADGDWPAYELLDQLAPDFSMPRLGGGNSRLSDYRGRVLILSFGGLWCPPCIVDGANTNTLASSAKQSDIDFLYMQCGPEFGLWSRQGPPRRVRVRDAERAWGLYFVETHFEYPVAFDLSRGRNLSHEFEIRSFPSTLIIDRAGVIREWHSIFGRRGSERFLTRARAVAEEPA